MSEKQTMFVGSTKQVEPLTDAELNYSPEEWAEALAEDPSCIRAYLAAAEERGRRRGVEERDALLRELRDLIAAESGVPVIRGRPQGRLYEYVARIDAFLAPRDPVRVNVSEATSGDWEAFGGRDPSAPRDSGEGT